MSPGARRIAIAGALDQSRAVTPGGCAWLAETKSVTAPIVKQVRIRLVLVCI
jgi:hypothetical protein